MPLTTAQQQWYFDAIKKLDPKHELVTINEAEGFVSYTSSLRSDESSHRNITPEELIHALAFCMLKQKKYAYSVENMVHEKHFPHGHKGSSDDEVDILIEDDEGETYAIWELKAPDQYEIERADAIKFQLFGTAPLSGSPKLLVYATVRPNGPNPEFTLVCIDYEKYKSYDSWLAAEQDSSNSFPRDYEELDYQPYVKGGDLDLRMDCTQADFRAVATTFHNEFFGEHPDNVLFVNLMKCLLAKIQDERTRKLGDRYLFQVFRRNGKDETAEDVFNRVNKDLYASAYTRYIDPKAKPPDQIDAREFPPERVKSVVKALQGMSIARGAALNSDVIGAFFEEILRSGFKQDRGMYFTHDNLVLFMLEAVDVAGLAVDAWQRATHPDNRLPYIIDPACGSGTFLLRAMPIISSAIRARKDDLVTDSESETFFRARMSDDQPNYWAENFLYGLDPKFVMAITAKVNMVLHGDGSAHIFKQDAFQPLAAFYDSRFRPAGDAVRSVPHARYEPEMCESFDLVVSNPPFGINLAADTKLALAKTFSLKEALPSEALFIERAYQLLKPRGRLALVTPESLLNTADAVDVRLFLYRMFWIKTVVSLPRNIFSDTPTLTSLLFAQKKNSSEVLEWDKAWDDWTAQAKAKKQQVIAYLAGLGRALRTKQGTASPPEIQATVLELLSPIIDEAAWMMKRGKEGAVATATLPNNITVAKEAIEYYKELLKLAGFEEILRSWVFDQVTKVIDYEYPVFVVDEVGYKLSKRKERPRPNHLCRFVSLETGQERPNLHLAAGAVRVEVNTTRPERVLDHIKKLVMWS